LSLKLWETALKFQRKIWYIYDHRQLEETVGKWLQQRPTTGNSDMAAKTGNTYMSGTTKNGVEIPTSNLAQWARNNVAKWLRQYVRHVIFLTDKNNNVCKKPV